MKKNAVLLPFLILSFLFNACNTMKETSKFWCDQSLRSGHENYILHPATNNWFKVYEVADSVFAIYEPYNFQEVISYLILGSEKALLFDTGMGIGSIKDVVQQLTTLPVLVLNSHTHYDHIGGNADFEQVLGMDLSYTKESAKGIAHNIVKGEVRPEALCLEKLPDFDSTNYHIRPFRITEFVQDGDLIDLGNRTLKIIATPGHTPDSIVLLDEEAGLLWTGDTFYPGPIYLFMPETDLSAYERSLDKLVALAPKVKYLLPGHNLPITPSHYLVDLKKGFDQIINQEKEPDESKDRNVLFQFEGFSFLIRQDIL